MSVTTRYYLLDSTKGQYNNLVNSATSTHKAGVNQAELSLTPNVAGDRILMKVKGDQAVEFSGSQDVILQEWAEHEHDQIFSFFYTAAWQPPE